MRPHGSVPRPRHLFPETAAQLIQIRRAGLRATRGVRQLVGQIPLWTAAAACGVMSAMLAILLFFLEDPRLQAAAKPVVVTPPPVVIPDIEPTPVQQPIQQPLLGETPPVPTLRSRLNVFWDHTLTPLGWDQRRIANTSSVQPYVLTAALLQSILDDWKKTSLKSEQIASFRPYSVPFSLLRQPFAPLMSANFISLSEPANTIRQMGLGLEKQVPEEVVAGEPITYSIIITNRSSQTIDQLSVRESVSFLDRVLEVSPPALIDGEELVWNLENFPPSERAVLKVTAIPNQVGEFQTGTMLIPVSRIAALASVNAPKPAIIEEILPEEILPTEAEPEPTPVPMPAEPEPVIPEPIVETPKYPKLLLSFTPVKSLKTGQNLSMIFSVTNIGDASAEDVKLQVRLSDEFEHRYGAYLKHQIQKLEPGQTRRALLQASAKTPGTGQLFASLMLQGDEKEARDLEIPIAATETTTPTDNSKPDETTKKVETAVQISCEVLETNAHKYPLPQPAVIEQELWAVYAFP